MKEYLSFDSVWLKPKYSIVNSRSEVTLATKLGDLVLGLPFISANMDTVTEIEMAKKMASLGGAGILHRFTRWDNITEWLTQNDYYPRIISVGIDDEEELSKVQSLLFWIDGICVDVAHIDTLKGLRRVEKLAQILKTKAVHRNITLIAGNIATGEAALRVANAGANVVKTSIAGGSVCTTRLQTGHMVPTLGATLEIASALRGTNVQIISDGGIRCAADVAKCIAAGASAVMLGSLLSGTDEAPGDIFQGDDGSFYKAYRGSASRESQLARNPNKKPRIEGISKEIPLKGKVELIIDNLSDGLRSALSYSGAKDIPTFQNVAELIRVI